MRRLPISTILHLQNLVLEANQVPDLAAVATGTVRDIKNAFRNQGTFRVTTTPTAAFLHQEAIRVEDLLRTSLRLASTVLRGCSSRYSTE